MYRPRTVARFSAVQALSQFLARPDLTGEAVMQEFLQHHFVDGTYMLFEDELTPVDQDFFMRLLQSAHMHHDLLWEKIALFLPPQWTLHQLAKTTLAVLWAGAAEIMLGDDDVPGPVIMHEYVNVAHAFLMPNTYKMIHAILHRILTLQTHSTEKNNTEEMTAIKDPAAL